MLDTTLQMGLETPVSNDQDLLDKFLHVSTLSGPVLPRTAPVWTMRKGHNKPPRPVCFGGGGGTVTSPNIAMIILQGFPCSLLHGQTFHRT